MIIKHFKLPNEMWSFIKNNIDDRQYCLTIDNHYFDKIYTKNGKAHREDGPACEWSNGNKYWYINGQIHREDGPAIEYPNGDKEWYKNDQLHREDGPATEYADGGKEWWLYGKQLTKEEFYWEKYLKYLIRKAQKIKKSFDLQLSCTKCNTINEYAETNQSDGSYICYNCR